MDRIAEAARRIVAARKAATRLASMPDFVRPADMREAYRVQDVANAELVPEFGPVVGHKIGATTPVMQRYLEIDFPCHGVIFASTVHASGVRLPYAAFRRAGVECEIAVRLARDLGPEGAPYTPDSAARAVAFYIPAIEIVDDRHADWKTAGAPSLTADNFFGAASVLGEPVGAARAPDLAELVGRILVNGAEVGRGKGADVLGHPHAALAWLANNMVERGRHLRAGEFVSTGSMVQTHWVAPGDELVSRVEGLGEVRLAFEAG